MQRNITYQGLQIIIKKINDECFDLMFFYKSNGFPFSYCLYQFSAISHYLIPRVLFPVAAIAFSTSSGGVGKQPQQPLPTAIAFSCQANTFVPKTAGGN